MQATDEPFLICDGQAYSLAGVSGTLPAALAASSLVFAMRAATLPANDPGPGAILSVSAFRLAFTTIVAFTTAVTAGRRLGLFRATAAMPTVGTALVPVAKSTRDAGADGGLVAAGALIAANAALTPGAIAVEANPIGILDLTSSGAAGARVERMWEFTLTSGRVDLAPGELLVVSNPVQMDAAGTWQIAVEVHYHRRDA